MASPMPEEVTISVEEYANLLMTQQSSDHVYSIVADVASTPDDVELLSAQEFARTLLDDWSK